MAESIQTRADCKSLREEVEKYERLLRAAQQVGMPEEDRTALRGLVSAATEQVRARDADLQRVVQRLIPKDYFPFAQPPERQDAAYLGMTSTFATVRDEVHALYDAVAKLQAASDALKPALSPAPAPAQPEPGEVADSSARPKKRRRLSHGEDSETPKDAPPTPEDLVKLQDTLMALEGRIVELGNDLVQFDNKVGDEVEAQLDYHLGKIGLDKGQGSTTNIELTERVEQLSRDVERAGERAEAVTAALKQLDLDGKNKDERNEDLRARNEKFQNSITEVYSRENGSKVVLADTSYRHRHIRNP